MSATLSDAAVRERVAAVEALLGRIETLPAEPRALACDAVQLLSELYGEALRRMLLESERVEADPAKRVAEHGLLARALDDELLAQLLLLHGLDPRTPETRVNQALAEVRPYLESHGGDVELVAVEGSRVRLRLVGSCRGCPSSAATLRLAIEQAIRARVPEIETIEADGPTPGDDGSFVPLGALTGGAAEVAPRWRPVDGLGELAAGRVRVLVIDGRAVLFLRLGEELYGYARDCPGCGAALDDAVLADELLRCAGCGLGFDARGAGRCRERPELVLAPVPLLRAAAGGVEIALVS